MSLTAFSVLSQTSQFKLSLHDRMLLHNIRELWHLTCNGALSCFTDFPRLTGQPYFWCCQLLSSICCCTVNSTEHPEHYLNVSRGAPLEDGAGRLLPCCFVPRAAYSGGQVPPWILAPKHQQELQVFQSPPGSWEAGGRGHCRRFWSFTAAAVTSEPQENTAKFCTSCERPHMMSLPRLTAPVSRRTWNPKCMLRTSYYQLLMGWVPRIPSLITSNWRNTALCEGRKNKRPRGWEGQWIWMGWKEEKAFDLIIIK